MCRHPPLSSCGMAPTARDAEASGYTTSGVSATDRPSSWSRRAHQVWVRTNSPIAVLSGMACQRVGMSVAAFGLETQARSYGGGCFDVLPSTAAFVSERIRRQQVDEGVALDVPRLAMPESEFLDSQLSHLCRPFTMVDDVDGIIVAMNRFMPRGGVAPNPCASPLPLSYGGKYFDVVQR